MSNVTESAAWSAGIYQLETTDPITGGPDGIDNVPHKNLANRTLYLKQFADEVATARGGEVNLASRMDGMNALVPAEQNMISAVLKFALDQAALANYSIQALKQQIQQEGEITIKNRGVVSGCGAAKSSTAARNLSLTAGKCFANGRTYSVADSVNAASVPSNTGGGSVIVYAYLYQDAGNLWRVAVTAIGQEVPANAIKIYNITIPANSTDATDPNLISVALTDVRRIESNFPASLNSPASASPILNILSANDYRLDFDVVSAVGAPCDADAILISSRATNGFTVLLSSAADSVVVRWRASKLNN